MAKTKLANIPHYELLYVIPNKYTEEEVKPIMAKVSKIIAGHNGKITYSEEWGKKKLAYLIKGNGYGYYNLVEFDLSGNELDKLNRTLAMTNEVLRYQVVTKPARSEAEIKEEKKKMEKRLEEEIVKEKEEPEKEKEKTKPKMDLKDLDEKLDKILNTDDLL